MISLIISVALLVLATYVPPLTRSAPVLTAYILAVIAVSVVMHLVWP